MTAHHLKNQRGFTLLEILVTLVVASILGAMLVAMTGNLLHQSAKPAVQAMEIQAMNQAADSVSRAYRELGSTNALNGRISDGDFNGPNITVTAAPAGYGSGGAPVAGQSGDLLEVTITGASGLSYTLIFGNVEI